VYDSGNNFDTSSHNWTCPKDGLYMANTQIFFAGGANGDSRDARIATGNDQSPNGEGAFTIRQSSESSVRITATTVNKYTSGDIIAGYCRNQDSSDSIGSGDNVFGSFLEVAFLGGL